MHKCIIIIVVPCLEFCVAVVIPVQCSICNLQVIALHGLKCIGVGVYVWPHMQIYKVYLEPVKENWGIELICPF